MIKINLLVGKKPLDMSNLGGFDLSKLNVKHLMIAIILSYLPDFFVLDMFKAEQEKYQQNITVLNKQFRTLSTKVRELDNIKKQIEALENLEKQLESKLGIVKTLFSKRSNPVNILLYISKNIPSDLWIKEVTLENNTILFKGESQSFKSIGVFIENLKSSIFFRKDIRLESTVTNTLASGVRVEAFSIRGVILSYE